MNIIGQGSPSSKSDLDTEALMPAQDPRKKDEQQPTYYLRSKSLKIYGILNLTDNF